MIPHGVGTARSAVSQEASTATMQSWEAISDMAMEARYPSTKSVREPARRGITGDAVAA